ncbi:MAG: hypothetical protein ISR82_03545 [Candidatus Marinimicrobia bacterium]|nr:hypothetical protein [Candidatus Neomarinimicrobiota bacterium]MBL7010278.1 hypothetical protein [Candidatus Neomarinimicrobiota bacterium]MBL7030200.1 hypothetical protein [Candidatus Neomarinimicrobiota bacterium]
MRYILHILCISVSLGQWTTFQSNEFSNSSKKSKTIFRTAGFATTHNFPIDITEKNRIAIGLSTLKGVSANGFLPMISGKMTVSWNLSLRGRMTAYSAEEGTIQAYGWGLSLNPSKDKEISKWIINLDSGKLNSNDALIVSAIQASAARQYNLNKFPVYVGFGLNILNANPKSLLDKEYQGKKEIQTNFINVGTKISMGGLSLIPQLWFGSQYSMVSVNIVGTF